MCIYGIFFVVLFVAQRSDAASWGVNFFLVSPNVRWMDNTVLPKCACVFSIFSHRLSPWINIRCMPDDVTTMT